MDLVITESLVDHVRQFLGEEGAKFFADVKEKHGRFDAVWSEGGFPHAVHFNEGMQIRNEMRGHPDCAGWGDHDFDGMWDKVVDACLSPKPLPVLVKSEDICGCEECVARDGGTGG